MSHILILRWEKKHKRNESISSKKSNRWYLRITSGSIEIHPASLRTDQLSIWSGKNSTSKINFPSAVMFGLVVFNFCVFRTFVVLVEVMIYSSFCSGNSIETDVHSVDNLFRLSRFLLLEDRGGRLRPASLPSFPRNFPALLSARFSDEGDELRCLMSSYLLYLFGWVLLSCICFNVSGILQDVMGIPPEVSYFCDIVFYYILWFMYELFCFLG